MDRLRLFSYLDLAVHSFLLALTLTGLAHPLYFFLGLIPVGLYQMLSALLHWRLGSDRLSGVYFLAALGYVGAGVLLVRLVEWSRFPDAYAMGVTLAYLAISVLAAIGFYGYRWRRMAQDPD